MTDAELATEAATAINKCGWEAHKSGDSSAADAYWAAARLVAETFKREVTP